ncbi:sucrose synthase [Chlorogloeopsis sp. ULAP01]|uniref:sucrose synthase n=1 Tax=Chlorogloeopsis sp. ULAP01 TaxID=3056483 RepID=UPI0025AAC62D|nr:sucrose synthase [Chlorogloeopsis sp. ULAP01]MDM9381909.1 sucrose synthase [Chlorogloeopsis sp. ULAP01]
MHELVQTVLNSEEKTALRYLISELNALGKRYFLRNEILQAFAEYCHQSQKPAYFFHSSSLGRLIHYTHEILLEDDSAWFLLRPRIASQEVWRLSENMNSFEQMPPQALLDARDRFVNRYQSEILNIDFGPFYRAFPSIDDPRNIGQGLAFLNRYLCSQVVIDRQYWFEVLYEALCRLSYNGTPLLTSDRIRSGTQLCKQIKQAIKLIRKLPPEEPYENFRQNLQTLGLEPGWGNTASRVCETLELFDRLLDAPEPAILEAFVSRVPAVFRVVLVSIHGWISQEDVLGRPETMGQVAYVLEQARSLENQLRQDIQLAGLDLLGIQPQVLILTRLIPNCEGTYCDLRLEKLEGTENSWILRVPFREFNPKVTQNWISRYEIWPYLETFAIDAEPELLAQLGGRPDLIIGNYSDGNLVAFLLTQRLQVTLCNIAHSLEKPKHLFSNLYWQDLEEQYHFSAQFTADVINMNAADFIITSSYHEIVGTPDALGQYESYKCFTMPQLYHVVDGINLFSPKFNLVPPGVDENIFFSYTEKEKRDENIRTKINELLFSSEQPQILGYLDDPNKRPICAVSYITSVKNTSGLAECFGKSEALQQHCNLILVTNKLNAAGATKPEEVEEIERIHNIINQYNLHGRVRWIGMRLKSPELGELYRAIADRQGIYVHFALFEPFGRTILEAMSSGLPSFVTEFGGAAELIEGEEDEFHLNPTDLEGTAKRILNFINQCNINPEHWHEISEGVIRRVHNRYNWQVHSKQLLLLSKIYRFWDFVTQENQEPLLRYVETLYHLVFKPKAETILEQHMQR